MSAPNSQLVVRRISGVDLRAATELFVHQQRTRGNADLSEERLRPAVQAALEDADRVLMVGAFHEGLPGFQHGKMVGVLMMNLLVSLEHAEDTLDLEMGDGSDPEAATHLYEKQGFNRIQRGRLHKRLA